MGSDWTGTGRRISRMAEKEGDGMDRRHTVLVVDSGAENCLLLSDMLRGDYNIVEVQDGREAMACLEHRGGEIALMLLDVDAPETGGLAALAAMEKSGYTDSVPVIVLSGDDVSSAVDQAWELGAVECVTRPYRAAVVRRRVRNVLMLYAKQRLLEDMVAEQLLDRERSSQIAVEVLSDIAAFRGNKSDHVLALLEQERIKYLFFASMSREIQFEYDIPAKRLTMSDWGADFLGISDVISNPRSNEILAGIFAPEDYQDLRERVYRATPQAPVVTHHYCLTIRGERRWYRAVARLLWMQAGAETPTGIIGKFVDVHEQQLELDRFKQMARHDALTGLYNRDYARLLITRSLGQGEGRRFAMLVLDLDFSSPPMTAMATCLEIRCCGKWRRSCGAASGRQMWPPASAEMSSCCFWSMGRRWSRWWSGYVPPPADSTRILPSGSAWAWRFHPGTEQSMSPCSTGRIRHCMPPSSGAVAAAATTTTPCATFCRCSHRWRARRSSCGQQGGGAIRGRAKTPVPVLRL